MPSFSDVLSKAAETIERPPLPPKGTYVFVVNGQPKTQERKEYEIPEFQLKGVRPTEDVDTDELKAYGSPANIIVRKSFLFNTTDEAAFKRAEFNLREFLVKHLGMDGSLTIKELMTMANGKQCLGTIDYRPDQNDPEVMYADLRKTAPIE
jgi:hypothetical protein